MKGKMFARVVLMVTLAGAAIGAEIPRFGVPEPVADLNTSANENSLWISADGLEAYLATDLGDANTMYHIYRTTRTSPADLWGTPVRVTEIDNPPRQTHPWPSSDGLTMYFVSHDPNQSVSDGKIWQIERPTTDSAWVSATQHLVPGINTAGAVEYLSGAQVTSGDLVMYYSRYPQSEPKHDIYMATRGSTVENFGSPQPLTELNSADHDFHPYITSGGLMAFFASNRPGGLGSFDLYAAVRDSTAEPFGTPVNLSGLNSASIEGKPFLHEPTGMLYFTSGIDGDVDFYRAELLPPRGDLVWSTFLGGSDEDKDCRLATDPDGNVIVVGRTQSADFPVPGGADTTFNGSVDVTVSKFSPTGELLWSTFLGGSGADYAYDTVADSSGNIYASGYTNSANFPTSGAHDATYNGGHDFWIAKFSPAGVLRWSTYLGTGAYEYGADCAVDAAGNLSVCGMSNEAAYLARFAGNGTLLWERTLNGSSEERALGIAVTPAGEVFIVGQTYSSNLPVSGGYDSTYNGSLDAFVAKYDADGARLWSSFLGGSLDDAAQQAAVDSEGNLLLSGYTTSTDFPTSGSFDDSHNGGLDTFMVKIAGDGSLLWSTLLGGDEQDTAFGIAVDSLDQIHMVGSTFSTDFPGMATYAYPLESLNAFVVSFTPDGRPVGIRFLGRTGGTSVSTDPLDFVCFSGATSWPDFPTRNAFDYTYNGDPGDDVVVKFAPINFVNLGFAEATIDESAGRFDLPVLLSDTLLTTATVDFDVTGGTATRGDDYSLTSGTIIFPPGVASATIPIDIFDEPLDEPDETIVVALSNPTSLIQIGLIGQAVVTIVDDDEAPVFYGAAIIPDPATVADSLAIETRNWFDGDGDPEGYLYQWTLNGGDIVGATSGTLAAPAFAAGDLVACTVTAWDGANLGNTIETQTVYIWPLLDTTLELDWSTYFGGMEKEWNGDLAVDAHGDVFVIGYTASDDFPTTGAYDDTYAGGGIINPGESGDVFLSKFRADGKLRWSTYLGGAEGDYGRAVAIDPQGNALIAGSTSSSDFLVFGAHDSTYGGMYDAWVAKVSPRGDLLWSTFLGGSLYDECAAIAVDGEGNAYVTGQTSSSDFPTTAAYAPSLNGVGDAFVTKIDPGGHILWCTFLGGHSWESGNRIVVASSGNVFVTGETYSEDFPASGPFNVPLKNALDAFLVCFSADGALRWSTCLGGQGHDSGQGLVWASDGPLYVTGLTTSEDFPASGGIWSQRKGPQDAFVAKFRENGMLLWATCLGGTGQDSGADATINTAGNLCITGVTDSMDFPVHQGIGSIGLHFGGAQDAFIARFNPAGLLLWSSFLGGGGEEDRPAIAAGPLDSLYLSGDTIANDFPTTNGYDLTRNGWTDNYVAKIGKTPRIAFAAATSAGVEDEADVLLELRLSMSLPESLAVACLVTTGTAEGGGVDYALTSGTVVFEPGQTTATIRLAIVDDRIDEEDETITIAIADSGIAVPDLATHVYTILDDDHTPSFTGAAIEPTSPTATTPLAVICTGWQDEDGDPEQYLYQWKRDGETLADATAPVLPLGYFGAGRTISCVVTATDGVNTGNTIETDPVQIAAGGSTAADRWEEY